MSNTNDPHNEKTALLRAIIKLACPEARLLPTLTVEGDVATVYTPWPQPPSDKGEAGVINAALENAGIKTTFTHTAVPAHDIETDGGPVEAAASARNTLILNLSEVDLAGLQRAHHNLLAEVVASNIPTNATPEDKRLALQTIAEKLGVQALFPQTSHVPRMPGLGRAAVNP